MALYFILPSLLGQSLNCLQMKKKLLVAGVALLTTAAVTATVLTNRHRKPTKDTGK
jgi:hypothetical protein